MEENAKKPHFGLDLDLSGSNLGHKNCFGGLSSTGC